MKLKLCGRREWNLDDSYMMAPRTEFFDASPSVLLFDQREELLQIRIVQKLKITNVLSITICVVLLIDKQLDYYYSNEKFNYVFMITINAIMLMSNFLILRGAWMQQQRYVMAWIFLYIVLVFLENVVGISAFILAMVAHASAWCAVPFVLMIILDVLYVYCILTVHKYCRSLEGYSVFP
ncbi:Protein of unknown function [Gryllus bimaculatus]|nr:Protein of unknown function [Gryllus bimaculatus]